MKPTHPARDPLARNIYSQLHSGSDWDSAGEGAKNYAREQAQRTLDALDVIGFTVVERPSRDQIIALNFEYCPGADCECCQHATGWVKDLDTEIDYSPSEAMEYGLALHAAGALASEVVRVEY